MRVLLTGASGFVGNRLSTTPDGNYSVMDICSVNDDECSNGGKAHCRGLCRKHYGRQLRTGCLTTRHNVRPRKAQPGENWCSRCSRFLPVEQFSRDSKRSNGLLSRCKACASKEYKEAYNPERDWARRLRSKYGITADRYYEILREQDGLCAICRKPPEGGPKRRSKLHVDHCHKTGRVRGLLCFRCNSTLGQVEESFDVLAAMVHYLEDRGME